MFSCCAFCVLFFMLHLFSCWTLFMLQIFSCYTIFMWHFFRFGPSLLTRFLFHSLHGALFWCCFSSHCALFILHSSMPHSFHVAAFISSTFLVLYSFHNALFHGNLPCITYIMLWTFKAALFHIAIFSFCTLSFLLHFFHVALYQVVLSPCYIFWKHLQSIFVLNIK